jgi:hypothetical protein
MYQVRIITKKSYSNNHPCFFSGPNEPYKTVTEARLAAMNYAQSEGIVDYEIEASLVSCL